MMDDRYIGDAVVRDVCKTLRSHGLDDVINVEHDGATTTVRWPTLKTSPYYGSPDGNFGG